MAKEREITTKFKVDISDLKAGITEANRQIRLANSEFKAATAGMDKWSESADGLQAKIKQLNSVIESEKQKLSILEEQYSRVAAECGEASKEAEELQIKINNQKATVGKAEAELKKYAQKLDDLENEASDAAKDLDKLGNEAKDAANNMDGLDDEAASAAKNLDKLGDEAKDAANDMDDIKDSVQRMSDGFTVAKGAVATFAGNLLTSLGGAIKNGISNILSLSEATQEYREDLGKLETAFADANVSTEVAKDTYKEFYAVLGEEDRSVEAVNHLAKFVDTEQDMAKWTNICTGVWGTFGDSLPIEGLTEAANETMKTGKITGVLADALTWAGVSEDEFQKSLDGCTTEQERQALITNTLNDLYSDTADAYRKNNESVIEARKANSDYTDSMAILGEKIEPITTKIREGFNKILQKVIELVEDVDMEAFAEKVGAAFDTFINDILPKIIDGLQWVIDNKDGIIAGIAGIGAAFVAWKVVGIIQTVISALKGMTVAQYALNLAMSLNPIGIIIALIAGLVAAFVTLWNNCDGFREFWINLWEKVKEVAKVAWDAITGFFKAAWDGIKLVWNSAGEFFGKIWDGIKNAFANVGEWFGKKFKEGAEARDKAWEKTKEWASNTWTKIKDTFADVGDWFGKKFKEGSEQRNAAWAKTKEWASDTWGKIKDTFADTGEWFGKKFKEAADKRDSAWAKTKEWASDTWGKITDTFDDTDNWFGDKFGNAWESIKNKFASWGEFWSGLWTKIKNKFSDIGANIGSAISGTIRSGLNGVLAAIERTINGGINLINKAINLANLLPGVNVGTIGHISLPRLAKGGVLKKGQVGLLEGDGAEAVVPLDQNKKWIRKTAQDMARELGMQKVINNKTSAPVTNYNFTQNNTSPKALSRLEIYRQTKNQLDFIRG